MTHEESSEAQAVVIERMWLSNHMQGTSEGLEGWQGLALCWWVCVTGLHTCDIWPGLYTVEVPVGTGAGPAVCQECQEGSPSSPTLCSMMGSQHSLHSF